MTTVASVSRLGGAVVAATLALLGGARAQPAVEDALDLSMRLNVQTRPARRTSPTSTRGSASSSSGSTTSSVTAGSGSTAERPRTPLGWPAVPPIASPAGNHDARATGTVVAAKPVIGLADLYLRPLLGLHGADPIRAMPGDTPSSSRRGSPPSGC